MIIEEIIQFNEQKPTKLTAETLLGTYIGERSEDFKFYLWGGVENVDLLQEKRVNQVLRLWGRFFIDLLPS